MKKLTKPKKLNPGDKVTAISLSWGGPGTFPHRYDAGVKEIEKNFNVKVIPSKYALESADFIYNNPKLRAEDLMIAFKDPEIKAIFCSIGGDDTIRLLPYIDYDIIKNNPKIFIGYSDTTVNNFICLKAGLSSFYGPSIMSGFAENGGIAEYTKTFVKKAIFSDEEIGEIYPSQEGWAVEMLNWANPENQNIKRKRNKTEWNWLQGDKKVQGNLIGGCMDVLEVIKGTEIWPSLEEFKDTILFLETSEDTPSPMQVTWWLRNYGDCGILNVINGIIFGRPGGDKLNPEVDFPKYDEAVKTVLKEYGREDLPVITQMDFGHTDPMFTIPFGTKATIDCKNKKFSIDESGVI